MDQKEKQSPETLNWGIWEAAFLFDFLLYQIFSVEIER